MLATLPNINSPSDLDYGLLDLLPRFADLPLTTLSCANLGAGNGTGNFSEQIQHIPFNHLTNVEIFSDALFQLSHNPFAAKVVDYVNEDMLDFLRMQDDKSIDLALVIDAIEHLTKKQGIEFLAQLQRVIKHRALLWLPFGITPQDEYGGNPFQLHQSTWTPDDFTALGSHVNVELIWRHFHVSGFPYAGFVTISL